MTVAEQLAQSYPLHFQRIFEAAHKQGRSIDQWRSMPAYPTASKALWAAFVWIETEEGHTYWRNLAGCGW